MPGPRDDDKPTSLCLGYPAGVIMIMWHAMTIGIAQTIWISTAPAYFAAILNTSGAYIDGTYTDDDNTTTVTLSEEATAAFSAAASVWAGGGLVGCFVAAPLPRTLGYRWSFIFFVFLACCGNAMYGGAGVLGDRGGKYLAWCGKALDGFVGGSVALSLSYIPLAMKKVKGRIPRAIVKGKTVAAMINFRALMGLGMMLGAVICVGLEYVSLTEYVDGEGDSRVFSGGDLVGWAMAGIFLPSLFFMCCSLGTWKPPVEPRTYRRKGDNTSVRCGSAMCTPYFTKQSCFWLFLVFAYGLTSSMATFYLPVFPYCPTYCNDQASLSTVTLAGYINYIAVAAFGSGFVGALVNSVLATGCAKRDANGVGSLKAGAVLMTLSLGLMYAGYRTFDEEATEAGFEQALFIVGICIYFFACTALSATMAPVFNRVIPATSISAMMPLYMICLDVGKIIGPLYSDWAIEESADSWDTRVDIAFVAPLVMFVILSVVVFVAGNYLATPSFGRLHNHHARTSGSGDSPSSSLAKSFLDPPLTHHLQHYGDRHGKAGGGGGGGGGGMNELAHLSTSKSGGGVGLSSNRPKINSYDNQRGASASASNRSMVSEVADAMAATANAHGFDVGNYGGGGSTSSPRTSFSDAPGQQKQGEPSLSYSQIADAKNIDSIKVSLVI